MKFGIPEIKAFAENHKDERVRIMSARLCEARSKNAQWNESLAKATKERDAAISILANWIHDIDRNGTGWDDWDENYKDAKYNNEVIRSLIDKEIEKLKNG